MPHTMKIQPIDFNEAEEPTAKCEAVAKPVFRSRFKWLFERPFSSGSRAPATEKPAGATEPLTNKDGLEEFEPSSVCLAKMVQNFMEENNEKQQQKCGRNRCTCFNGNCTDSSDDEPDFCNSSFSQACDTLKVLSLSLSLELHMQCDFVVHNLTEFLMFCLLVRIMLSDGFFGKIRMLKQSLVPCVCVSERNLLADTAKIVERHKINKRKDGFCRKIVADGLIALGYDAAICKSKWEKSPSFLAGEYEYVDVMIEGERLIIDIDFRSEFAIARPTKSYKLVLQTLPNIFIGKSDRLEKIIGIISDAVKQSLKKKGMPVPPWRKADYVKSKWLSASTRISPETQREEASELEVILGGKSSPDEGDSLFVFSNSNSSAGSLSDDAGGATPQLKKWELPLIRPKSSNKGVKIVTGLASVIDNKP